MDHRAIIKGYVSSTSDLKKVEKASHVLCDALHEFHITDKEKLHELAVEIHEIYDGPYYNEHFAKHDVSKMFHKGMDGMHKEGEHFSTAQARTVLEHYGSKIGSEYGIWDVYVALNANYHDKAPLFKKWFPDNYEDKIIEDAITFYFMDADAPKGKIWEYMQAMCY